MTTAICDENGIASAGLRAAAACINRTDCGLVMPGVVGWLTAKERRALYALAKELDGPFLEIGAWAGLSTCHIASAIRDSGTKKRFITTDLNPTLENFRPLGSMIGFFYPPDSTRSRGLEHPEIFDAELKPVLTGPGGVLGALRRNLQRLDLAGYVDVREGHFADVAPDLAYTLVFIDAVHDPEEIDLNGALLRRYVHPGTILACHDMTRDPRNEECLRARVPLGERVMIDSLLIGEVVKEPVGSIIA